MDKEKVVSAVQSGWEKWIDTLLNNPFVSFILKLILAIIVVIFLVIISKIIASSIKKKVIKNSLSDDDYVDKIANLVWDIVFYTLLIFDIFIGFEILWFDLWILLGWLSFWIWLAFKEILWNMIAGILILTTKDYALWDLIKIDWNPSYMWFIEEITIRYTIIREFNNQKVIIPNLTFITSPIKPITTEEFIRLETVVSVHYDTDLDLARKIIINAISKLNHIVNKWDTDVIVDSFADSGINLKIWFYIDPNDDIWPAKAISLVNNAVNKALKENNIVIPYPHTTVTVDKNDQNLLKTILFMKK